MPRLVLPTQDRATKQSNHYERPMHLHYSRLRQKGKDMAKNKNSDNLDNDLTNFKSLIVEMTDILLSLSMDDYLKMKCMLLANAAVHCLPGTIMFLTDLFKYTDEHRPLLLEVR